MRTGLAPTEALQTDARSFPTDKEYIACPVHRPMDKLFESGRGDPFEASPRMTPAGLSFGCGWPHERSRQVTLTDVSPLGTVQPSIGLGPAQSTATETPLGALGSVNVVQTVWKALARTDSYLNFSSALPFPDSGNRILMYHSVGGGYYDDFPPERFRRQLDQLTSRYDVVDLPQVTSKGERTRVALTFDDGTRDFFTNVRPILHEYGVPATVFVISDIVTEQGGIHGEESDNEYMSKKQIVELVDDELVTVGNHTRCHPRLSELSIGGLRREIVGAKRELESVLGVEVQRFAYPHGDHSREAVALVRQTHEVAVTGTSGGSVDDSSDPHRLPRINGAVEPYQLEWAFTDCSAYLADKFTTTLP